MLIKRNNEDGSLKFKVYRKKTHTDRYLDFNSNNPIHHKKSVVKSLFDRANLICDKESYEDEEKHIIQILKENNYPKNLINKVK